MLRPVRLLSILLALLGATLAASAFEGWIHFALKTGRDPEQLIAYAVKDTRIRLEPKSEDAGGTALLIDTRERAMFLLMPAQRIFVRLPLKPGLAPSTASPPPPRTASPEATGIAERFLNYPCLRYVLVHGDSTTESWVTTELGGLAALGASPLAALLGGGGALSALERTDAAFPLKVITRDSRGRETFRFEALEIEPGPLPDELFAVPAGFRQLTLPAPPTAEG